MSRFAPPNQTRPFSFLFKMNGCFVCMPTKCSLNFRTDSMTAKNAGFQQDTAMCFCTVRGAEARHWNSRRIEQSSPRNQQLSTIVPQCLVVFFLTFLAPTSFPDLFWPRRHEYTQKRTNAPIYYSCRDLYRSVVAGEVARITIVSRGGCVVVCACRFCCLPLY